MYPYLKGMSWTWRAAREELLELTGDLRVISNWHEPQSCSPRNVLKQALGFCTDFYRKKYVSHTTFCRSHFLAWKGRLFSKILPFNRNSEHHRMLSKRIVGVSSPVDWNHIGLRGVKRRLLVVSAPTAVYEVYAVDKNKAFSWCHNTSLIV